jgi:hypothetical protein
MTDAIPEPKDGDDVPVQPADEPTGDAEPGNELEPVDDDASPGSLALENLTLLDGPMFEVGPIVSSLDYAKLLPQFDFADIIRPQIQPILDVIARVDFGVTPIVDAAILKSLDNFVPPQSLIPEGFFNQFVGLKFPELESHVDTLRAIESLVVPPPSKALEVAEEVVEAEIVDDEPGTDVELPPTVAEQHLAMTQRLVEMTQQLIEQNAEANARADKAETRAADADKRAGRGNVIAVVGIIVGVIVAVAIAIFL